jgi:hypothetical protein
MMNLYKNQQTTRDERWCQASRYLWEFEVGMHGLLSTQLNFKEKIPPAIGCPVSKYLNHTAYQNTSSIFSSVVQFAV